MTGEMILSLVNESNDELLLKTFLKKINQVFGEDYAVETLCINTDMAKSINRYSKVFDRINNTAIAYSLIKAFILSPNKDNSNDKLINDYILQEKINELKELIKNDLIFRKYLIRKFINQSDKKNLDLYKKQNDKLLIIEELEILSTYEKASKVNSYLKTNDYKYKKSKRRSR